MTVRYFGNFQCPCGLVLEYQENHTLVCKNPTCEHHKKVFQVPTVILEEA